MTGWIYGRSDDGESHELWYQLAYIACT